MKTYKIYLFLIFFLKVIQTQAQKEEITQVNYGTSFGMCEGYCFNETKYTQKYVITCSKAWKKGNATEQKDKLDTLKNENWAKILAAINLKRFKKLQNVIGCPDCNDGGQEWIEITTKRKAYKVTIEYNADTDFECLKNILIILRKQTKGT